MLVTTNGIKAMSERKPPTLDLLTMLPYLEVSYYK